MRYETQLQNARTAMNVSFCAAGDNALFWQNFSGFSYALGVGRRRM